MRSYFYGSLRISKTLFSISKWNKVNFFFIPKVVKNFTSKNVNILKNIFLKFCNDLSVWFEIQKMIEFGLINFSDEFIYEDMFSLNISLLSIFLIEIYFSEFDSFVSNLSFQFNSVKDIRYLFYLKSFIFNPSNSIIIFPIYLEKLLFNIKYLVNLTNKNLFTDNKSFYVRGLSNSLVFCRRIFYIRYKDHFMFGFSGSKDFSLFLMNKISSFFRSTLFMTLLNCFTLSSYDDSLYFLGYKISCKKSNFNSQNYILSTEVSYKFNNLFLFRINYFKTKFTNYFVKRVNYELSLFFTRIVISKDSMYNRFKDRKFWMFLFQFEAVRAVQFWILFDKAENKFLFPYSHFFTLKFLNLSTYKDYSFDLYIFKSKLILGALLNSFNFSVFNSVLGIDLYTSFYLVELKKRIFFSYVSFSLLNRNLGSVTSSFQFMFLSSPKYIDQNFRKNTFKGDSEIQLLAPINYIYYKLRNFGFVHQKKTRPISNSKFLFLTDMSIIRYFGFLAYSFIFWYRYSDNFLRIKYVVEFLRQSCFLTLCRKHNKSKYWAYKVFTSDLVLIKGLFNTYSFFPTHHYLLSVKKKTRVLDSFFCLNEVLFLSFTF